MIRHRLATTLICVAVGLLTAAAPAAAVSHKQATAKALAALGAAESDSAVIVFALPKPLRAGSRVTQGRAKGLVLAAGRERTLFF
nr:hypothetical protein [Actinomycetota bacterium]